MTPLHWYEMESRSECPGSLLSHNQFLTIKNGWSGYYTGLWGYERHEESKTNNKTRTLSTSDDQGFRMDKKEFFIKPLKLISAICCHKTWWWSVVLIAFKYRIMRKTLRGGDSQRLLATITKAGSTCGERQMLGGQKGNGCCLHVLVLGFLESSGCPR